MTSASWVLSKHSSSAYWRLYLDQTKKDIAPEIPQKACDVSPRCRRKWICQTMLSAPSLEAAPFQASDEGAKTSLPRAGVLGAPQQRPLAALFVLCVSKEHGMDPRPLPRRPGSFRGGCPCVKTSRSTEEFPIKGSSYIQLPIVKDWVFRAMPPKYLSSMNTQVYWREARNYSLCSRWRTSRKFLLSTLVSLHPQSHQTLLASWPWHMCGTAFTRSLNQVGLGLRQTVTEAQHTDSYISDVLFTSSCWGVPRQWPLLDLKVWYLSGDLEFIAGKAPWASRRGGTDPERGCLY